MQNQELERSRREIIENTIENFLRKEGYIPKNPNCLSREQNFFRLYHELNLMGVEGILKRYTSFLIDKGVANVEEEANRELEAYLNRPISSFGLSVRPSEVLKENNIRTVRDLTESEIHNMGNLGRHSQRDIRETILEPMG